MSGVARAGSPETSTNPRARPTRAGSEAPTPSWGSSVRRACFALVTLFVISILIFAGTASCQATLRTRSSAGMPPRSHSRPCGSSSTSTNRSWSSIACGSSASCTAISASPPRASIPITTLIAEPAKNSAILAWCAALLLIPLALVLGVLAALRAGRGLDHTISVTSLAMTALPEFVTGTLFVLVFALTLDVLPAASFLQAGESPLDEPAILVLPVATLLAASLAQSVRMVRAGMVEALRSDYVEMARLNGYEEREVVLRHALRNALAPSVQVIALNIQWLVGGIVVTEYVFGYPGLGQTLVNAVAARDIPFVQCITLLVAAVYLTLNVIADLLVVLMIPKLRTAQ